MTVPLDLADVQSAATRIAGGISSTPLTPSARLSMATGAQVLLKRDDLQPVRSYKIRGALNLISQLDADQRAAGVVAASAGNHAQGVALACADLGVQARILLPSNTPRQKRDRVLALGRGHVTIVVGGETYDAAAAAAAEEAAFTGATLVPAFDDPRVIAGQGTLMLEVLDQVGRVPDVIVVPVGGGGLLAGSIVALGDRISQTRLVGVEPAGAAALRAALDAGRPVILPEIDTFADGAATKKTGDVTYSIIKDADCEVISVKEGAICVEMLSLYQDDGIIAEPAGALATAALAGLDIEPGQTVVCVLSGGNNDVSRYAEIVERALIHEGRKHYFLVEFPQEPGALRRFLDEILGADDDISLFEYVKRSNREYGPALVGVELGSASDFAPLMARMKSSPLRIERVPPDSPLFRYLL